MTPITTMQPPCTLSGTRMYMRTWHPLGSFSGRIEYKYGAPAKRLHTYLRRGGDGDLFRKFCSRSPIGTTGRLGLNSHKTKVFLKTKVFP